MALQNGGPLVKSIGAIRSWRDKNLHQEHSAALIKLDADLNDEGTVYNTLYEGAQSGNSYDLPFHISSDLGLPANASQDDFLKKCEEVYPDVKDTIDSYHAAGYKLTYIHSPDGGKLVLTY